MTFYNFICVAFLQANIYLYFFCFLLADLFIFLEFRQDVLYKHWLRFLLLTLLLASKHKTSVIEIT